MKKAKKINKNSKKQIKNTKKINKPSTTFQKIINGRIKGREDRLKEKKKEKKSRYICQCFSYIAPKCTFAHHRLEGLESIHLLT